MITFQTRIPKTIDCLCANPYMKGIYIYIYIDTTFMHQRKPKAKVQSLTPILHQMDYLQTFDKISQFCTSHDHCISRLRSLPQMMIISCVLYVLWDMCQKLPYYLLKFNLILSRDRISACLIGSGIRYLPHFWTRPTAVPREIR